MHRVYAAGENDIRELNRIAYESEAYWGYDQEYMDKFRKIYKVTGEYVKSNPTFIFAEGERIIGFYSLKKNDNETELEFFYIDPQYIGKGYGKKMWDSLADYCKSEGIKSFMLVTSPQARGFYEKMGAVVVEEVESLLRAGRKIPRLMYNVTDGIV
ncbi:MAG TPA: GNAT family N-acetyltransferase [Clostridiaceae bacterium]|nr:GNAT family N-acetyltransferase [Clostridiaceae bacterium]